ncbi:RDD family protein [Actinotalea sp. K2]|uniref:RDD family protein n=1 Tax=Actinotalea sp. K2 TaxID=2939438 RepID=UPI0020183A81|nr:RDD family protein [Actinotalea sp. K2]MCL3862678.1 RDD family protein [Actinotalea sp. K2]
MSDEILTGEGVVLDARPASFATRTVGALIDLAVLAVVAVALLVLMASIGAEVDDAAGAAIVILLLVTVMVGIPTTVETLTRGRSLGKLVMGLRIVRDDGGPVRFRHAFIRAMTGVGELWLSIGSIALICSLVNRQGKRVGDLLAGTYAVRVRGGQRALPPVVMPHELSRWAHGADIRRLPDGLALQSRQFLGRATGLHPGSRERLGLELAGEVEQYVAPGPPPGTHPERFLAAVLAERRDREYVQAVRAAQRARAEAVLVHRLPHAVPDPVD